MRTPNRKRAILVSIRGVILVLLAVILQWGGWLDSLESLLYDERVRYCQGYQPPPAPQLVHLDVDDRTLGFVGHWPWPPSKLARIVDEIGRAKPKVLAMDVIFVEPTDPRYGGEKEDQILADSFHRLGCALAPVSLNFDTPAPQSRLRDLLLPLLEQDPERTRPECLALLSPKGIVDDDFDRDPLNTFNGIRETAFFERIWRELAEWKGPPPTQAALKQKLLPHEDPLLTGTVLGQLFDDEYDTVVRQRAMLKFTLPASAAGSTPLITAAVERAPILQIGQSTAYSGYVDYLPEKDGTVRLVPLLARYRDEIIPHMDLVAACAALGADVHQLRLTDTSLTIPRPGGNNIVIPVSVRDSSVVGTTGALMEVPLFGHPRQWQTMYDVPLHERPERHVSVYAVWQICETLDKLATNESSINEMLAEAFDLTHDDDTAKQLRASPLSGQARHDKIAERLSFLPNYITGGFGTEEETKLASNIQQSLPRLEQQIARLDSQLAQLRRSLYDQLHDRAIFFGGTATSLADLRGTTLFGSTPGVVIHGAIFNAILTGKMWRRTSDALGLQITALMGLITLLIVSLMPPGPAFTASAALALGYLALNGYILFARDNYIVSAAGPLVAVAMVWGGMTLGNIITERADRARITRRFRSYVDPTVVDFYVNNPDHQRFDGERRELTIGFSDLAGFTTLTDQMGEKVVPLLAEYVGEMVPIIRGHRGNFDKQIGDGLCFFFGAPIPDDQHALHAVQTALDMHAALAKFNQLLKDRDLPPLGMRIGIATGDVIVGDAGPPSASSYTTLGGTTNLAARLEPVNKLFGTRTLITARTVDLMHGEFLTRPIANIRVAGKLNCVVVHEPMCLIADATDHDRKLADCTEKVFHAYRQADFAACIHAARQLEEAFGHSKFARYYLHLAENPPADLSDLSDGQIILTEK